MSFGPILKRSALALALTFASTAALAHDQTDCELEGESYCDDIVTTVDGWENCAWIVAVDCYGHTHSIDPDGNTNKFQTKRLDDEVKRSIRRKYTLVEQDPQLLERMQRENPHIKKKTRR